MKAMLLSAPSVLEIVELPDPAIARDDDVLVRVRATSICGSDTHGYTGATGRRTPPLVMGHEATGEIVAVGPGVTAVAPGDRVFTMPMHHCGICSACRNGAFELCPERKVYGGDLPGAFAELFLVSEQSAIPIPDSVSFRQAALIEPLAVVMQGPVAGAHRRGRYAPPSSGVGPSGSSPPPSWRCTGRGTSSWWSRWRRDGRSPGPWARRSSSIPARRRRWRGPAARPPHGLGVDVTVEAVGSTASVASAVNATRAGGQLVWLGNVGRVIEIDEFKVVWKQLTIHASVGVTRASVERAITPHRRRLGAHRAHPHPGRARSARPSRPSIAPPATRTSSRPSSVPEARRPLSPPVPEQVPHRVGHAASNSQQEVAPASSTPRERSPSRLARPTLATRSRVDSLPCSAAWAMAASAVRERRALCRALPGRHRWPARACRGASCHRPWPRPGPPPPRVRR